MAETTSTFAAVAVALYAAHHVGDYWVQTDQQARHKGEQGGAGRRACGAHVATYLTTQAVFLAVLTAATGLDTSVLGILAGLTVSGVTHWMADRREHGLMFRLARAIPGFMTLGVPRERQELELWGPCPTCEGRGTSYDESTGGKCWDCKAGGMLPGHVVLTDNPSLGTGTWA